MKGIVQLTGFSDPVYAEAYVDVNQFDIFIGKPLFLTVADILVVNQTADTLHNLTVEFATLGDLKLVEKPGQINLGPHGFASIKANIKVYYCS